MTSPQPVYIKMPQTTPEPSSQHEKVSEVELKLPEKLELEEENKKESCCKRFCADINPCTFSLRLLALGGAITGLVLSAIDEEKRGAGIGLFLISVIVAKALGNEETNRQVAIAVAQEPNN